MIYIYEFVLNPIFLNPFFYKKKGDMLVCDRPLSKWRENLEDDDGEEGEEEEEERLDGNEFVDWENGKVVEDVGNVRCVFFLDG